MGFQSNDSFFTTNVTVLRSSDDIVANNLWVFNQMNLFSPPMPRFWGVLMIYLLIIYGFSIKGSIFCRVLSRRMQKSYQMTLLSPPMPRFWGVLIIYSVKYITIKAFFTIINIFFTEKVWSKLRAQNDHFLQSTAPKCLILGAAQYWIEFSDYFLQLFCY